MNMEWKDFAIGLLSILSAIGGWLMRQLWDAVKELRKDLSDLKEQIAREYVPYDRLQDALKPIMDLLHEVRNKLDTKVDK